MSFGNGFLLWGLLLAAVPIIIHLLNRRRYKTVRWAALDFLRAAFRKNQKRLRIENLLLLIVRTAIIILLALAVAKPVLEGEAAARLTGQPKHYTILLDNSYSMGLNQGGTTPFTRAVQEVRRLVDQKAESDSISLYLAVDNYTGTKPVGPRQVFRKIFDPEAIRIRLEKLEVSAGRSDLAEPLSLILREMEKKEAGKSVTILTDMQRNAFEPGGVAPVPGDGEAEGGARTVRDIFRDIVRDRATVTVIDVGAASPRNIAVASIRSTEDRPLVERSVESFEARILNFGPNEETRDVEWTVDGEMKGSSRVRLAAASPDGSPGEGRARFVLPQLQAGPHSIGARIPTDALTVDDARILPAEVREKIRVLAVDGDPRGDSGLSPETLYLQNAIAPEDDRIIAVEVIDYLEFLTREVRGFDVLVLANLERVREDKVKAIERYVADGGGLVVFLGDLVDPSLANRDLWNEGAGVLPAQLRAEPYLSTREETRVYLGLDDAAPHPLVAQVIGPEADPEGFWKELTPKVWGFYRVDVDGEDDAVKVLLRYTDEDRSPALLERRFGRGRVLLFTTAADYDWNEFPNGGVAIPLMHVMVTYLTPTGTENSDLLPFRPYVREVPGKVNTAEVLIPGGELARAVMVEQERRTRLEFDKTDEPGPYRMQITRLRGEEKERQYVFAVNVDAEEGDVRRVPQEEFEELYGGPGVSYGRTFAKEKADDAPGGEGDLSGLLILLVLGLLIFEVFLARRFGDYARHHSTAEASA